MGLVYQKNKKTGITYVYQNEPYWDKEKQQSRAKRTLIGKLDPDTAEIVPTRSYKKKTGAEVCYSNNKTRPCADHKDPKEFLWCKLFAGPNRPADRCS